MRMLLVSRKLLRRRRGEYQLQTLHLRTQYHCSWRATKQHIHTIVILVLCCQGFHKCVPLPASPITTAFTCMQSTPSQQEY